MLEKGTAACRRRVRLCDRRRCLVSAVGEEDEDSKLATDDTSSVAIVVVVIFPRSEDCDGEIDNVGLLEEED